MNWRHSSLGSMGRESCSEWLKSTDLSVHFWDPRSGMTDWVSRCCCLFLVLITWNWSAPSSPPAYLISISVHSCCSTVHTQVVAAHERSHYLQLRRKYLKMAVKKVLQNRNIKLFLLSFFFFFVKTKQKALSFNLVFIWVKHKVSSPHHPYIFIHPVWNTSVYGLKQ